MKKKVMQSMKYNVSLPMHIYSSPLLPESREAKAELQSLTERLV